MPLICTPPGGVGDPLQQSRKIGVYIRLSSLTDKITTLSDSLTMDIVADELKREFLNLVSDFLSGKSIPIVRDLRAPTMVGIND